MTAHLDRAEIGGLGQLGLIGGSARVLRGELGPRSAPLFAGMQLRRTRDATRVTGRVRDQAHLHGLLDRVQDAGLELVAVNPLEEPPPPSTPRPKGLT